MKNEKPVTVVKAESPERAIADVVLACALSGLGMSRFSNHRALPCADDFALAGLWLLF